MSTQTGQEQNINENPCSYCFGKTFVLERRHTITGPVGFTVLPSCKTCRTKTETNSGPDCDACGDTGYSYLAEDCYAGCNLCDNERGGYAERCTTCKQHFPVDGGFMSASTYGCPHCKPQSELVEDFENKFCSDLPSDLKQQLLSWAEGQKMRAEPYSYDEEPYSYDD